MFMDASCFNHPLNKWNVSNVNRRARFWLKKSVDDECKHKHMGASSMATAAKLLEELDATE